MSRFYLASRAALALLLAPALAAAADVHTVGAAPTDDFPTIQQAVNAALDGDVILVRDGSYPSFVVDDKELAIFSRSAPAIAQVFVGSIRTRNLSAGKTVVYCGLRASGTVGGSESAGHGAWVINCLGSVRFQDCVLTGGEGQDGVHDNGWSAVLLDGAQDVVLSGCTLRGGDAAPTGVDFGEVAGAGLSTTGETQVGCYDCAVQGGHGQHGDIWDASHGAHGADLGGNTLFFASGGAFYGGYGGSTDFLNGFGGNGGDGIHVGWTSTGYGLEVTAQPGSGGAGNCWIGCWGDTGVNVYSSFTDLGQASRRVDSPSPAFFESNALQLGVRGTPGDAVWLLVGSESGFNLRLDRFGISALEDPWIRPAQQVAGGAVWAPPLDPHASDLGFLEGDTLSTAVPLRTLPAGVAGVVVHLQTLHRNAGVWVLGSPLSLAVVDPSFDLRDCNQNGQPDAEDVASGSSSDCDLDGIPDECGASIDCDGNGVPDSCDIANGTLADCDGNGIPDVCGGSADCDGNGVPDSCDIANGTLADCDGNGIPDVCGGSADCDGNGVPDPCDIANGTLADCDGNGIPDVCGGSADCNGNGIPDVCDIANGTSSDCDGNGIPEECGGFQDCNGNGMPDACDIASGTSADIEGNGIPDECQSFVLFVDDDAPPGGNGTSWAAAISDLQVALATAEWLGGPHELWVAEGVYRPAEPGDLFTDFVVGPGISLFGGFAGGETSVDERDPDAHPTILDGDLDGNDLPGFVNRIDNSHRILRIETPAGQRISGFVVRGCYDDPGGGSGAVWLRSGLGDTVLVDHCLVTDNIGAGMRVETEGATILSCRFIGNRARIGAGLTASSPSLDIVDCLFAGNECLVTPAGGAGMYLAQPQPNLGYTVRIRGCTVVANHAGDQLGAGVRVGLWVSADIRNSVIWGNWTDSSSDTVEEEQVATIGASFLDIGYSCIEGLATLSGPGMIGADPLFVDPLGPDGLAGTLDDDLRLGPLSPCVDAGRNGDLPEDTFDLDGDGNTTEPIPFDLDGNPRRVDDPAVPDTGVGVAPITDMGAFERQGP